MKQLHLMFVLLAFIGCGKQEIDSSSTPTFTLNITAGNGGSVSNTGGTYDQGTQVTITATPNAEYVFSNWSNGSTENPITLTINSNTTLSATFIKRRYPLSIYTQGQGTVSETLVSAGKTPSEYTSGSVVRLTANPANGWVFSAWSGAVSSSQNPVDITLSEARTVTATFNQSDSSTGTGTVYNQDNSPSYINVVGQGEFTVTVTAEKDGLIDVTILPLESENSYWDFYQTDNTEVNLRSKVKQTIQQDLGDVDPNAQNLITIHYVNRPRKL